MSSTLMDQVLGASLNLSTALSTFWTAQFFSDV